MAGAASAAAADFAVPKPTSRLSSSFQVDNHIYIWYTSTPQPAIKEALKKIYWLLHLGLGSNLDQIIVELLCPGEGFPMMKDTRSLSVRSSRRVDDNLTCQ